MLESNHLPQPTRSVDAAAPLPRTEHAESHEPWWVKKPPPIEIRGEYSAHNAIFYGKVEITDGLNTDTVYAKVFDPEGKIVSPSKAESHALWSQDAPHQQTLRRRYAQMNPGEPIPILHGAATHDQNQYPAIIQELAPQKRVSQFINDEQLDREAKREIYFSAVRQYAQLAQVGIAYGLELGDKEGQYYTFGDQKASDLCWDSDAKRLVVLDLQRINKHNRAALETDQWGGFSDLAPAEDVGYPRRIVAQLLDESEIRLLDTIKAKSSFGMKTQDVLILYRDFARHALSADDPRLRFTSQEKALLTARQWQKQLPEEIRIKVDGWIEVGHFDNALSAAKEIPVVDDKTGIVKSLYESLSLALAAHLEKLDVLTDQSMKKETEMALIGLHKYIAGEWNQERFPEEIQWKQALCSSQAIMSSGNSQAIMSYTPFFN